LRTAGVMAGEARSIGRAELPEDLLEDLGAAGPQAVAPAPPDAGPEKLRDLRASAVAAMLRRNAGNVSAAARALGVSRNTIYRTLKSANGAADQSLAGSSR